MTVGKKVSNGSVGAGCQKPSRRRIIEKNEHLKLEYEKLQEVRRRHGYYFESSHPLTQESEVSLR
jgi:hypothetical protein